MRQLLTCFLSLYAFGAAANTQPLLLEDVLASTSKYFPQIEIARYALEETRGKTTESQGAFDARLETNSYQRMSGFYSGDLYEANIVKPLPSYNAKASVGYRYSDGQFPVYEDYFFTNEGGELNGKLSLSLLRNRDIDPKRFALMQDQLEVKQSQLDLLATKFSVHADAYQTYLEWVAIGLTYRIYHSLLEIAQQRQEALKIKEKKGDIANIVLVENRQFILQRQEILRQVKRQFENISQQLSMFVRDEKGQPMHISFDHLPAEFPLPQRYTIAEMRKTMDGIAPLNPRIKKLENALIQAQNKIKLGENNTKTALDLELSMANDFGNGSPSREELESTALVNLSIPLQTQFGKGQIKQGKAKKRQLEKQKQLELEKLRVHFEKILNNIAAAKDLLKMTEEEIVIAQKMEVAERRRFENGQSDFFFVNIREVSTVEAKVNNLKAKKYLASMYVNYLVATLDDVSLGFQHVR